MDENPVAASQPRSQSQSAQDPPAEETAGRRHRHSYTQESSLRKTLVFCILGFSLVAAGLTFVLCVGAWSEAESRLNEDLALTSWTETYIKASEPSPAPDSATNSPEKMSVEITWFVNGLCVNATEAELQCPILSNPKTNFDLPEFVNLADGILSQFTDVRGDRVSYVPFQRRPLPSGSSFTITFPALVVSLTGAACVLASWASSASLMKAKTRVVVRIKHLLFFALQSTATACFLIAAIMIRVASGMAAKKVKEYTGDARFVLQGNAVHSVAWTAAVSQLSAMACIYGFRALSIRLEKPEMYRAESRRTDPLRRQRARIAALSRPPPAQDEFVDPDLPPYSQVDPLAPGPAQPRADASSRASGLAPEDIELQTIRIDDRSPTYREVEGRRSDPPNGNGRNGRAQNGHA